MTQKDMLKPQEIDLRARFTQGCFWFNALLLIAMMVFFTGHGTAQVIYGSMVGTVTDSTGAVIPEATVKIVNTQTSEVHQTATGGAGEYKLSTLAPGIYNVTISKPGFGEVLLNNVEVKVNSDVRADASLKPGKATEVVTVTDEVQGLQTDRAEVRTQITGKEIADLPFAARNFESVLTTVPGNNPPSDQVGDGSVNNPARSMTFDGNGVSSGSSNIAIEGVSAQNAWITNLASYVPAQDSIQTVDVVTGSFNAEQGTAGGTSVNVQLKSGTNSFHGTAFEDYTGSKLETWPRFFDPKQLLHKPQLVYNQWGGTLGGPILKNKLFGFVSAERLTDHETLVSQNQTLPLDVTRSGCFANPIYDPTTGNPDGTGRKTFAQAQQGNAAGCPVGDYVVPTDRWDPADSIFLAALPHATNQDATFNNFTAIGKYVNANTKYDAKIDYNASSKLHINYRLSALPNSEIVPPAFGAGPASGPPVNDNGQPGVTSGNVLSNALSGVYTITPHLVVDANVGYTYLKEDQLPPLYGTNYGSDTLHIPNANGPDPVNSGVPQFQIDGYFPWFGTWYSAIKQHDPNHTIEANLTWVKGTHSMRFGGNYSKIDLNIASSLFSYSYFQFNGGATSLNGGSNTAFSQENTFADFLLGLTNNVQKSTLNTNWTTERTAARDFYGQDQWQASRKLTVNYGVRWNYYPVPTRDHRGIEIYDINTNAFDVCGKGGLAQDCGVHVSPRLFSPLAGIAYRLNDKMVVRVGGGINYEQQQMFRDGTQNYPGNTFYNVSDTNGYIPYQTVANGPLALAPGVDSNGHPDGLPILQKPPQNLASYVLPSGTTIQTLKAGDYKRGYVESWNLTVERELIKNWSGQVAYVGTQSVHEYTDENVNIPLSIGGALPYAGFVGTSSINTVLPLGHSHYNSLQSTLRHRFSSGYLVTANYTWSKWIGQNGPLYPGYKSIEKSLSTEDRTNNFNLTTLAELPFGKGKPFLQSGFGAAVAGGWQANFILLATSGNPFTVTANSDLNTFGWGTQLADKTKAGTVPIHPGHLAEYFDVSYFTDNHPTTRFGNAGFTSLRGPGIFNLDVSLSRKFQLWERLALKIRGDAFNFTNTPHFANPGSDISNVSFDSAHNVTNLNGVGQISSVNALGGRYGLDQRQIRFEAHFEF